MSENIVQQIIPKQAEREKQAGAELCQAQVKNSKNATSY